MGPSGYGAGGYGTRFVFRDHLGSTSVIANGSGATISKELYLPYGDVRYQWRTGSIATQTQYRYTGQRMEAGVAAPSPTGGLDRGLSYYGARWYDASLARFISADTIIPQPGNPQALNRYSYVLNNPLRYTDPTGMFSEDEIMQYLGVKTWEEVLAMFGEGGILAGEWGWLEVLRQAELGDTVSMVLGDDNGGSFYFGQADVVGSFYEEDGQLMFAAQIGADPRNRTNMPANLAPGMTRQTGMYRVRNGNYILAPYKHYHVAYDPAKVDWLDVGLDAVGASDALGYAMMGAGIAAVTAGTGGIGLLLGGVVIAGLANAADMTAAGKAVADYQRGNSTLTGLMVDLGLGVGGTHPGYGTYIDLVSLGRDIAPGIYLGP